jgi:hypothetical protein
MSFSKSWVLFVVFLFVGCGGGGGEEIETQDVIGTISEVDAEEQAISMNVPDSADAVEAGTMDLEFTDTTEVLTANFAVTPIDSLQADQDVRAEVVEEEDQYVPSRVIILPN